MWILVRGAIAVIAFLLRVVGPFSLASAAGTYAGETWYRSLGRSKGGKIYAIRIGMALGTGVIFRLQRERSSDLWLKRMGFEHEFQTGDAAFDDAIYIACDHPGMLRLLHDDPEARRRIRAAFDAGFRRIVGDGRRLWLDRNCDVEPGEEDLRHLASLREVLARARPGAGLFADPFNARVVVAEAIAWSIFAYALGGLAQYLWDKTDVHVEPLRLVAPGLALGVVAFVALGLLVRRFLGGSSRGGVFVMESLVLLAFALPVAGIQAVADANRVLDNNSTTTGRWVIKDVYKKSGYRSLTRYYITLSPVGGASGADIPETICVPSTVYNSVARGTQVEIEISPGAFGYPWYRRIEARS